jgi:hypothetical protein
MRLPGSWFIVFAADEARQQGWQQERRSSTSLVVLPRLAVVGHSSVPPFGRNIFEDSVRVEHVIRESGFIVRHEDGVLNEW